MFSDKLRFYQILLSPLKALYMGHIVLLAYFTLVFGFAYLACTEVQNQLQPIIQLKLAKNFGIYAWGKAALLTLVWALPVPFLIPLIAVPMRSMWEGGKLNLIDVMRYNIPGIHKSWHAILLSYHALIYVMIPLIAVIALYNLFGERDFSQYTNPIFLITAIVVSSHVLHWVTAIIFSILIAICADVQPVVALTLSRQILADKLFQAISIILLGVALIALTQYAFHPREWTSLEISPTQVYLSIFIVWYTLSSMSVLALEAAEDFARKNGRSLRQLTP